MPNRHRGEIEAELGGERRTLVLTLGALAELELAFEAADLLALAERFERGRVSARDAILISRCRTARRRQRHFRCAGRATRDAGRRGRLREDRERIARSDLRHVAVTKPQPFPWPQVLAIGLGVLRLPPEQFWRTTPREFAAALRGLYGEPAAPIDRDLFEALARRFPDAARRKEEK